MKTKLTLTIAGIFLSLLSEVSSATKDKWLFGETDGFEISSNASVNHTKKIVEELQLVSAVFQKLNPNFVGKTSRKLRVIICRDDKTTELFSALYEGKPKKLGGFFHNDYEGGYILINDDGDFESSKHVVYHEYVHFLSNNRKIHLPRWLSEGVAEVFSTITPKGKNDVIIGNPPFGRVGILRESRLIPLGRLFNVSSESPEYNSNDHGRGVFYAESWALVHYLMFGKTEYPDGAYQELIKLVLSDFRVSEEKFTGIFGIGFTEMEKRLNRYINSGSYHLSKIEKPEIDGTENLELRDGIEGEENLQIGMVRLSSRGPSQSAGYLISAYKSLPNSPDAAAFYGYLDYRNENFGDAAKYLKEAVDRGSKSPATHLYAAIAKLRELNPNGSLTERMLDLKTTVDLLKLLFKAREMGEYRPELYYTIGRVWNSSQKDPLKENLSVMFEGARLYRDDAQIGFYLSLLVHRIGMNEEAKTLVEHYMAMELSGSARKNFAWLKGRIDKS